MKMTIRAIWLCLLLAGASGAALAQQCPAQTINFGETKNGALTTGDCVATYSDGSQYYVDIYQFSGTAGQQIAISNSSTAMDVDLTLWFPDGTSVYQDDTAGLGTNARIPASGFMTLMQTGTYEIWASTFEQLQTGPYTLTLTQAGTPSITVTGVASPSAGGTVNCISPVTSGSNTTCAITTNQGYTLTGASSNTCGGSLSGSSYTTGAVTSACTVTARFTLPTPTCTLTASPSTITTGQSSTLTATCTPAATSYTWTDTGFAATASSGSVSPTVTTTYEVFGSNAAGNGNTASATVTVNSLACLFTWAESTYPSLFSPRSLSQTFGPYSYRYYSQTNSYLAVSSANNHVYYIGVLSGNTLLDLGDAAAWNDLAGCSGHLPVTGGTFSDPSGASVTVTTGEIPPYVNAMQPTMTPSPSVPSGMTIDPAQGDVNVTTGAPGYDFNLSGDSGFTTTTAGAVTVSLPFNALAVPSADQGNPVKTFVRVLDSNDNSQVDLTGDISITGSSGMLTVETRGLPSQFTAAVIYNPNMDAITSEEAPVAAVEQRASLLVPRVAATVWPAQGWCVIYNSANPNLIAAVKNLHGLAGNPTTAQIRSDIVNLVGGSARKSQTIYQTDGMNGPNLYIGRTCPDRQLRYNIHMTDGGSKFQSNDPGEVISSGADHFGRLYVDNARLDDSINTALGTVLASVSHEMLHGIQSGYQVCCGSTPKGYREGSAATYGKSIDNDQTILVRNETQSLGQSLMTTANAYGNQDFFAYVARQYNTASLNYLSGLYAQMRATIGARVYNPSAATMYGAMDTYFKAAFSQSLQAIYLDFVKQRALTHNAASQFGRAGEVTAGFAEGLFTANTLYKPSVDVATCKRDKIALRYTGLPTFATFAIVITPTGVLPAGATNPTLEFKFAPTTSAIDVLWSGFTHRAGVTTALATTNKFPTFGRLAGDQVVILVPNLNPAAAGTFDFEIGCVGVTIDSISPVKGPVDTSVTINGSGFGTAADTRSVTFNGVTATTVTFNSDTQAVAKVPQNASTGDVIVTVNGERSNGVNFEVIAQCSATQNAGGDTPDTRTIELGKPAGTFIFNYQTYTQKDQIIVRYQGNTLFDTGCVGAQGSRSLSYGGTSTQITVQVIPNCAGGSGTAWNYSVSCP